MKRKKNDKKKRKKIKRKKKTEPEMNTPKFHFLPPLEKKMIFNCISFHSLFLFLSPFQALFYCCFSSSLRGQRPWGCRGWW